jgi:hypothetical protein
MHQNYDTSANRLGVGARSTGLILTPVAVIDACIELRNFVWHQAESLRREVGFGWYLDDDGPACVSDHLKVITSSTVSGNALPIPLCQSRPFLSVESDGALAFWGSINRFRRDLGFELIDDLNLALWQVAVAVAEKNSLSPSAVMLLEADLVGRAFLRASTGAMPASRRVFALNVLTFGIADAICMEVEQRG